MKQNRTKLWIGLILTAAFLLQGPLHHNVLTFFLKIFPGMDYAGRFLVNNCVTYIAFFACMYLLLKKINEPVFLAAGLLVIDVIGDLLSFLPVSPLVYQIIRPLLVAAWLLLIFLGANKKIVLSKPLMISGICLLVANVILIIVDHIYYTALLSSFGSNFMSFFQLLSAADSIFGILATASFYGLAFVLFLLMLKSQVREQEET